MKHYKSLVACFFCAFFLLVFTNTHFPVSKRYVGYGSPLAWDATGYNAYLPGIFIYKDIKYLNWWKNIKDIYGLPEQLINYNTKTKAGGNPVQYTCGLAYVEAPFFFIGHGWAKIQGYPQDGYSKPYVISQSYGLMFVVIIGLFVLRSVLLRFFPDGPVALTLICMVSCTNLLAYSTFISLQSHGWMFSLYCFLIWLTIRFWDAPSLSRALAIGAMVGWATITRPNEMICALVPIGWGINSLDAFKERLVFGKKHITWILAAGLVAFLFVLPQLVYWKYVTGDWVFASYGDQGFDWLHPHFDECFFGFRKGWFTYTPIMLIAVLGLVPLWRAENSLFKGWWLFAGYTALVCYITFAWWCWWYAGGIGQRAMIHIYPLLAIPLTALFTNAFSSPAKWVPLSAMLTFFAYYNYWLHSTPLLMAENTTKAYFLKTFLKSPEDFPNSDYMKTLYSKDEFKGVPKKRILLALDTVANIDHPAVTSEWSASGKYAYKVGKGVEFSPVVSCSLSPGLAQWIRAIAKVEGHQMWVDWEMAQWVVRFELKGETVKYRFICPQRLFPLKPDQELFIDVKVPEKHFDKVSAYVWQPNTTEDKVLFVDDLKLEIIE